MCHRFSLTISLSIHMLQNYTSLWETEENREIKVKAIYLEYNVGNKT